MRPAAPPLRPDTPFVASKRQVTAGAPFLVPVFGIFMPYLEDVEALRPKRKKLVMPSSPVLPAQEKIFSMEEVRSIVQKALDEHEKYIRAEYDRVLQERLNGTFARPVHPCLTSSHLTSRPIRQLRQVQPRRHFAAAGSRNLYSCLSSLPPDGPLASGVICHNQHSNLFILYVDS